MDIFDINESIKAMKDYLAKIPAGSVDDDDKVHDFLITIWDYLDGTDLHAMNMSKLRRITHLRWEPPELYFEIERHGAINFGSSRAEVQTWYVDLDAMCTGVHHETYRQAYKRAAPLFVKPIAEEIAELIINRKNDDRLQWYDNKTLVKLVINLIIPDDSYRQTITGRRRRFRAALIEKIGVHGWQEKRANVYYIER